MFSCGEWTDVPGPGGRSVANGSQPAQGAPQPAAGECESFIGKVLFFGRWLLPVPVSSGDIVTVTNALGAATDYIQDFPDWRCGDGTIFIAGGCVNGTETFNGGDPAPAIHHGNLIAFDGTNYYDCGPAANGLTATVLILPGITDQNLVFMLNFAGPAGAGDNSFDVRICKQAANPLLITYTLGSGPAAVNYGDTVNFVPVNTGSSDYNITFHLDRPAKMTILGTPGFAVIGSGTFCSWDNPTGTQIGSLTAPAHTQVTDYPNGTTIEAFAAECGIGGAPWTLQVRFDP